MAICSFEPSRMVKPESKQMNVKHLLDIYMSQESWIVNNMFFLEVVFDRSIGENLKFKI